MTETDKFSSGFSLIELAIVLVIIGLLVGMGAGLMGPVTKKAKLTKTRDRVTEVYNSIIGYAIANKTLPANLTVLGVKTTDSYGKSLFYDVATGITASDLCTTKGTPYITVNDLSAPPATNIAFIVLSQGENLCNETGLGTPFTIIDTGVTGSCAADATYGYDDIVMYLDIITLRQQICNTFRIVTSSLPAGTEAVAYPTVTLQATDGTTPYDWSVSSGSLPSPLSLDAVTGQITGTPASDGTSSFTVSVEDDELRTVSRSFSITVNPNKPVITTLFLHRGTVSTAYNATLSATGGDGTYSWSLASGSLPPGLNPLSVAGVLSGTPTTAGTYSITVQVADGDARTDTQTLSITIM